MGVPDLSQLPPWGAELLEQARVARLGMSDENGHPRVLPVTFALAEGRVWSAIDEKPKRARGDQLARVRFLRRDPRSALTVDRYDEDWERLAWVQVLGEVEILEVGEAGAGLASLTAKYQQYRGSPPQGPLLALQPHRCLFWHPGG